MQKYDEEFKLTIVKEYLKGTSGSKAIAAKYGVSRVSIKDWANFYRHHGEAGLRGKPGPYTARFKLSVLNHMWEKELPYNEVAAIFNLRGGARMIAVWVLSYHRGGLDALEPQHRGRRKKMKTPEKTISEPAPPDDSKSLEDLRKENEYLRAEVAYLKKLDALVRAKTHAVPKKHKQ